MRKAFWLFLICVFILASCTFESPLKNDILARINFKPVRTQAKSLQPTLSAFIDYTDPDTLLWNVTLTKTDGGPKEGEGTYPDQTISDTLSGFSLGTWNISLEGHTEGNKTIYTGQASITLTEGVNNIEVSIVPSGAKGSVCFTGCNFDGTDAILYCVMIDGTPLFSYPVGECAFNDDTGLYEVAETTQKVNAGVHNMQIQYGSHTKSFLLRVEPNMTTYVTYGVYEGKIGLTVLLNEQDAIVTGE